VPRKCLNFTHTENVTDCVYPLCTGMIQGKKHDGQSAGIFLFIFRMAHYYSFNFQFQSSYFYRIAIGYIKDDQRKV